MTRCPDCPARDLPHCRGLDNPRMCALAASGNPGKVAIVRNASVGLQPPPSPPETTPPLPYPPPEPTWPDRPRDMGGIPVDMVAPGDRREGIWKSGVLQIQVGRACDLSCFGCSQGSNLAGSAPPMSPEDFEKAVKSLEGYPGVFGVFGGNPATSRYFEDYCRILRENVPFERRGLWCNHPRGKGKVARITFNPAVSNLNVHLSEAAHAEFVRDWPECEPYLKGLDEDSRHGSPWVALKDVVPDEAERWKLIGDCRVNRHWSAILGVVPGKGLRAYFCEVAFTQAVLHADDPEWPDLGMEPTPGWWKKPMADFEAQVRWHCHNCGIPLDQEGEYAIGGDRELATATHAGVVKPKRKGRPVEIIDSIGSIKVAARPATEYLVGTTPGCQP
jgi:hypothetical protein